MTPVGKIKVISQLGQALSSHVVAYVACVPHGFSSALAESGWTFLRFNSVHEVFQVSFVEVKGLINHLSADLQYYLLLHSIFNDYIIPF